MSEQTITHAKPTVQAKPQARGILQRQCACGQHTQAGEECEECRKKHEGTLQRAAVNTTPTSNVPPVVHDVLNSPGQSLDAGIQAFMEPRFGHDFSGVRVHTDAQAAESARAVNALAYTVGRDVVFGAGQYAPTTSAGKRLLAHELTHVVQQDSQSKRFDTRLVLNTPEDSYEQEADHIANLVTTDSIQPRPPIAGALSGYYLIPGLQRKAECSLEHIEKECNNAAAACMAVQDECKKRYPKPSDIDEMIRKGRQKSKELTSAGPNAAANMLHFLDNTGTEKVMPTDVFANHKQTKDFLMESRQKFLNGAKKRIEDGTLSPDVLSEQMVWTSTRNAFSLLSRDDLGYAVGGYTICSKARVKVRKTGTNKFEVSFVEWTVQAFDCYNWDPGKGINLPGASDTDMCCIENAGKAKHFRIRTDEWKNTYAESMKPGEITATPPAKPAATPTSAPEVSPLPPPLPGK